MIVGIDGAFVRATSLKNQRRHFEVVLGRIEPIGGSSMVFLRFAILMIMGDALALDLITPEAGAIYVMGSRLRRFRKASFAASGQSFLRHPRKN